MPPFRPLFAVLLPLLVAPLRGADEERFDPPLAGAFLGLTGHAVADRFVVDGVEPFSAAALAGLAAGDEMARIGPSGPFRSLEDFSRAVGLLSPGRAVEAEVIREGERRILTVVPDPAVLRDHYRMVACLRGSPFLRARPGFAETIASIEAATPGALRAASRSSEAYEILNGALGRLGTSHTAIIPPWAYLNLFAGEQGGIAYATGIILERFEGDGREGWFACEVLDGSPAAEAGVLSGDEVVAVNGIPFAASPRRGLAGYEASRPHATIGVDRGETIEIEVRRDPRAPTIHVRLAADRPTSAAIAGESSLRRLRIEGRQVAAVHLWSFLSASAVRLIRRVVEDRIDHAEGLVVDFRGRGGQVAVLSGVVAALKSARRPVAVLVDRDTRSAKEIAAAQLKGLPGLVIVGETTAGAVLPGTIVGLPGGAKMMLPLDPKGIEGLTPEGSLEGKGVAPDIPVRRGGPHAAGADPIYDVGLAEVLRLLRSIPRKERL